MLLQNVNVVTNGINVTYIYSKPFSGMVVNKMFSFVFLLLNICIYVVMLHIVMGHECVAALQLFIFAYLCLETWFESILLQPTLKLKYFMHPNGD